MSDRQEFVVTRTNVAELAAAIGEMNRQAERLMTASARYPVQIDIVGWRFTFGDHACPYTFEQLVRGLTEKLWAFES